MSYQVDAKKVAVARGKRTRSLRKLLNRDETLKLIESVRKKPNLWDRKHMRKRTSLGQADWEDIKQKEFESYTVTVNELKVRWKTLRDSFRREVRRIENGEAYASRWPLYEQMQFILGHFRPNKKLNVRRKRPRVARSNGAQRALTLTSAPWTTQASLRQEPNVDCTIALDDAAPLPLNSACSQDVKSLENAMVNDVFLENPLKEGFKVLNRTASVLATMVNNVNEGGRQSNIIYDGQTKERTANLGDVTYKNKFRSRINTETANGIRRRRRHVNCCACINGLDDPDCRFLMSLTPFLKKMSYPENIRFRLRMLELVSNASHV